MNAADPRHGTTAGYWAHRTGKSRVCDPCREARKNDRSDARPCRHCSKPTTSLKRTCRACLGMERRGELPQTFDDDDALTGGQWVPRDGIMRWEATCPTTSSAA